MQYIYDLSLSDWQAWVLQQKLPAYRALQIYQRLSRGISSTDEMVNIPKNIRGLIDQFFLVDGLHLEQKLESSIDQTRKYNFRLADGNRIESVRMIYKHGQSVCISSQAGCRMGCSFCASTGAGFGRSLTAGEMLAQVALIGKETGQRASHVVIMGIGEPFENSDNLLTFLQLVNDPQGLGISMRHISVSTCGLVPEMLKFTDKGLPVTLSVSLHAPNDMIRRQLMPIARQYDYEQLMAACRHHIEQTRRRISFEYALFADINDRAEHAAELADRLKGMLCHVNLIPANEYAGGLYRRSSQPAVQKFLSILLRAGVNATVRRELGTDILAACGQLRRTSETCGIN